MRNRAIKIPSELQLSNQVGELIAIKETLETCPIDILLTIYSDSKYAIHALTKNLE